MTTSRYPRRDHRLAPAILRELLHEPVPAAYLQGLPVESMRLCDLDESAWQRFPEATCRELAQEVVRVVSRGVRAPSPIAERCLPPLPQGMRLTDLQLEARTLNCLVTAGLHQRPQDLRTMTVERILSLRGFWVKCLVDLLTSLEYAIEHPEWRHVVRSQVAMSTAARVASRYPRRNHALAPQTLREVLVEPIPPELVRGTPLAGRRLYDLDESVWQCLSPETIHRLAERIIARVGAGSYARTVQQRALPRLPHGVRLEDLPLENRTYNCLCREGFSQRPEGISERTVGDFLAVKAFGARCLVDLLTTLESLAAHSGHIDEKLASAATALAGNATAMAICFNDPRLGALLRAADSEANTVSDLVGRLIRRRVDPTDPSHVYEHLCQFRRLLEELPQLPLHEELIGIFAPTHNARDRELVAGYYGWDGQDGHTLEELGRKYGLSRERVRQICVRALKRSGQATIFAPVLDRALAFLGQRVPKTVEALQAEFDAAGFSACRLSLDTVYRAAGFLGRTPPFAVVSVGNARLAVRPDCVDLPQAIVHTARRAVLHSGAATLHEVAADLAGRYSGRTDHDILLVTLKSLDDFAWLDEGRGWFKLQIAPQHGLAVMIYKILAVAQRISAAKLRAAVLRHRRSERGFPPAKILLEICRRLPGLRVEGNVVLAERRCGWEEVLGKVEATMVRVLTQHGPVLERGELEERCLAQGVNRFSFNAIVTSSPVIVQCGRSMYGLLGAKIDRKAVRCLAAQKAASATAKVLRDYGRTDDGRFYLTYRLSKAAIAGGVITVPSALKQYLRGRFGISTPDGREAGNLVAKNGCAWGLGPVLRAHKAQPGDQLMVFFDTSKRQAEARLGAPQPRDSASEVKQPL